MALDYDGWSYSCPIDIDPTIDVPCTLWVGAGCAPELFPIQFVLQGNRRYPTCPKPVASRCTDRAIVGGGGGEGEHSLACIRRMLNITF